MLAAGAASGASGGTATPAGFGLVLDGRHRPDLTHEGTFTTSASFCPSGSAVDLTETTLHTVLGEFACAGSTDSFTAQVSPTPAEHGGTGSWKIVAGKGALATLRGKGTWTSVRLSGSDADPASITFRSTWHGVTDFDRRGGADARAFQGGCTEVASPEADVPDPLFLLAAGRRGNRRVCGQGRRPDQPERGHETRCDGRRIRVCRASDPSDQASSEAQADDRRDRSRRKRDTRRENAADPITPPDRAGEAPRVGLEPTTLRLTAGCSAN
jgi:hypothetical protein